MEFETAVALARQVEESNDNIVIAGFRRTSYQRPLDSWAVDLVNPLSGTMITLDEKDDWPSRLQELTVEAGMS